MLPVGARTRHVAAMIAELLLGGELLLAAIAVNRHVVVGGWGKRRCQARRRWLGRCVTALYLMELEGVRIVEIPAAGGAHQLRSAGVVVVGSVVVELSFAGEGLLTYRTVIGGGLSAPSARHHW